MVIYGFRERLPKLTSSFSDNGALGEIIKSSKGEKRDLENHRSCRADSIARRNRKADPLLRNLYRYRLLLRSDYGQSILVSAIFFCHRLCIGKPVLLASRPDSRRSPLVDRSDWRTGNRTRLNRILSNQELYGAPLFAPTTSAYLRHHTSDFLMRWKKVWHKTAKKTLRTARGASNFASPHGSGNLYLNEALPLPDESRSRTCCRCAYG